MELLSFPNDHLFKPCNQVTVFGPELKVLLESMWETMIKHKGLGLSSNQVGFDYTMFTMIGPEEEKLFIINPKVLSYSKTPANLKEGCLSAKGEFLIIKDRPMWTQIMYQDETGGIRTGTFSGIHSVCVNHEMEHLNGNSYLQSKTLPREIRRKLNKKWGLK